MVRPLGLKATPSTLCAAPSPKSARRETSLPASHDQKRSWRRALLTRAPVAGLKARDSTRCVPTQAEARSCPRRQSHRQSSGEAARSTEASNEPSPPPKARQLTPTEWPRRSTATVFSVPASHTRTGGSAPCWLLATVTPSGCSAMLSTAAVCSR